METTKFCKDCEIWMLNVLSVRVDQSELRFCREKGELRFAYDYQCERDSKQESAITRSQYLPPRLAILI